MIFEIIFRLFAIPFIAIMAGLFGMGLIKKLGITLAIITWTLILSIPVIWLIVRQRVTMRDSVINLIFYLVLSVLLLLLSMIARKVVRNSWLRSNNNNYYQTMVRANRLADQIHPSDKIRNDRTRERESIAKTALIGLPNEPNHLLLEFPKKALKEKVYI